MTMTSATKITENTTARRSMSLLRDTLPLGVCSLGICSCYWLYGYLQETLITKSRLGATFLLLIQAFTNVVVAFVWMAVATRMTKSNFSGKANKSKRARSSPSSSSHGPVLNHRLLLMTSFCYVVAMTSSNESLAYVSYPTAVLMKSCKLIPSLLMGVLVEKRTYNVQTWVSATFISLGMCLFHSTKLLLMQEEQAQQKHHKGKGRKDSTSSSSSSSSDVEYWYGIGLLVLSLSMDGLLGACQGLLNKRPSMKPKEESSNNERRSTNSVHGREKSYRPPTAAETMFYINLYSMIVLIPLASVGTGQLRTGVELLKRDSSLRQAVVLMNAVVGVGQIFIFLCLTWYTPYITTLITTTRKFFTIVISVVLVNSNNSTNNSTSPTSNSHGGGHNEFGTVQWIAVILVFVGIYGSIMSAATTTTTSSKAATHPHGDDDDDDDDDEIKKKQ
mmetsp:Transcript_61534/g.150625  ORF Transcript_61534/g.150625 Transcript_61534/m.150625 type:complete len:446 (-) Transcript_61534:462-1799(-)